MRQFSTEDEVQAYGEGYKGGYADGVEACARVASEYYRVLLANPRSSSAGICNGIAAAIRALKGE